MKFKTLIKYYLFWQLAIVVIVFLSATILPLRKSDIFLGEGITKYLQNPLLNFRSNFDGVHYILIATQGYNYGQQAFFPFYPELIKQFRPWVGNPVLAGTLISSVSFLLALLVLNRLIRMDAGPEVSKWTILALLIFPTSFFFASVYTEGLFFLLVILAFYQARRGRWWLAAVCGALASYTRFVGIFLLPALAVEFWVQYRDQSVSFLRIFIRVLPLLLIPSGLLIYMYYLQKTTGDPLAFYHLQTVFGQSRSPHIILPYQVVWRYIKMVITVSRSDFLYLTVWLEFITGLAFLLLSLVSFFKQRASYAVFSLLAFLVPTLTGNFVSVPRYVLVCFPSFIIIGLVLSKNRRLRHFYFGFSAVLMIIFLSMFARGYWVS